MILYHGTNQDIDSIDLKRGSRNKDFGQGFYLTPDIHTAERMARKKARFYGGEPVVITYHLNDTAFHSEGLQVLVFPEVATPEWIRFIFNHREQCMMADHQQYDIVKGPIADDGVALQLSRLKLHVEQAESIALDLQDHYLDQQVLIATSRALTHLTKQSVCKLH